MRASAIGILAIWVAAFSGAVPAVVAGKGAALRLQGSVEPVRSHPVIVPRLTGSGTGTLVIVHLVKPGTRVKRGELLIEFDRQAQIKTAHDRQAEYRDFVEQINRKRGEQLTASAHGEAELKTAENAVKSAELEVQKTEIVPPITAEQNRIRENMRILPQNGQYYDRLLAKLNEQESTIEKLQAERKELTSRRDAARKELDDYLDTLNTD